MKFRVCKSNLGRYRVEKRIFFFWIDCSGSYDNIKDARATKKYLEEKYKRKKKNSKETWKPLLF